MDIQAIKECLPAGFSLMVIILVCIWLTEKRGRNR